jgi:hypothetical protein
MKNRTIATLLIPAIVLLLMPSLPAAADAATGTIKGTLIDSNGQALVGYKVTVVDSTGAVHESAPTGPDGKYEIPNLTPGTYTYQIFDPSGKVVPVRIPAVDLKAGTAISQPIAIVPKGGGRGKGPLIAWLAGGGAAVAAIAIAANDDDDDDDDDDQMTASAPE